MTTASVGSAVYGAAGALRGKLLEVAAEPEGSDFKGVEVGDTELIDGILRVKGNPDKSMPVLDILKSKRLGYVEAQYNARPSAERQK